MPVAGYLTEGLRFVDLFTVACSCKIGVEKVGNTKKGLNGIKQRFEMVESILPVCSRSCSGFNREAFCKLQDYDS